VVNIHSERSVKANGPQELLALAPSQHRVNGMGTGIIIDPRGYIVTNHHVVEEVNLLRVRLADGSTSSARVVARDNVNDLALLKIDVGHDLPVMPLGTATDLMVGETVVAIGNAYGYDHTVTAGVVSAIHRDVTLNKEISYKNLIQTDASINPGNSGGPLLNIRGELVGVNVAIRAGAQGIGFAIPVDTMMRVAADMLAVRRQGLTHGLVLRDQVSTPAGKSVHRELVVEAVEPGSRAAQAGVKSGDVLVRVGDQDVCCRLELERALNGHSAGDRIAVDFRRNGLNQAAELTLATIAPARSLAKVSDGELIWRKLGLRLERVSGELVSRTSRQLHGGLAVTDVRSGSAADRAGLRRGDILVGLHLWEMLSQENVLYVLTHPDLASFNPLRFFILRTGQVHRGWLQITE
jgi:serine protease Do